MNFLRMILGILRNKITYTALNVALKYVLAAG